MLTVGLVNQDANAEMYRTAGRMLAVVRKQLPNCYEAGYTPITSFPSVAELSQILETV